MIQCLVVLSQMSRPLEHQLSRESPQHQQLPWHQHQCSHCRLISYTVALLQQAPPKGAGNVAQVIPLSGLLAVTMDVDTWARVSVGGSLCGQSLHFMSTYSTSL